MQKQPGVRPTPSQGAFSFPSRILLSLLLVLAALALEGCSTFSGQNEFLTNLQSKRTPGVKGITELGPDVTKCNALARKVRIHYKMCELAHKPAGTLGGWYSWAEACGIGEELRQALSRELGKEVIRIDAPLNADEMEHIYQAKLYNGILLGKPTGAGIQRAIDEFSKLPPDCFSKDILGKPSQVAASGSNESRQLREKHPMLRDLNSTATLGVQGTVVVDRDFANCNKSARETFVYHGFCQMKRLGAPGWFPPDACERAEKARKLLSLSLGKEVVNVDGVGDSESFMITPSRKGVPVSPGDVERFIAEFTKIPAECRSEGR